MTNYSPLVEALGSNDGSATVEDMRDEGYTQYDEDFNSVADIQAHIALALDALDGEIFNDPAKWQAVNRLVAAMEAVDEYHDTETTVRLEDGYFNISTE